MSHPFHSAQCGCAHDTLDQAQLTSLYPFIDLARVRCYNESSPGQARRIIRPWEQRLLPSSSLSSHPDDADLLLLLPFITTVTVRSLTLTSHLPNAPSRVRLFINRDDLDLATAADTTATQEFNLAPDPRAELDYPLKVQRFQGVSALWLHFPSNHHDESPEASTVIDWLHAKGVASGDRREAVAVVYEAIANPKDHRASDDHSVSHSIH